LPRRGLVLKKIIKDGSSFKRKAQFIKQLGGRVKRCKCAK
jgi:hypothetical protein